jgi:hypothetical protein
MINISVRQNFGDYCEEIDWLLMKGQLQSFIIRMISVRIDERGSDQWND